MKEIKLVIWDLDDTFWKGTLSEGEISLIQENISLIKTLTDRGIVNSICSKNNFEQAETKLREIGVWELFVFPSIDWTSKAARIKQIICNMQLRAVNVLFVDDNINNLKEAEFTVVGINTSLPSELAQLISTPAFKGKEDFQHKRLNQYKILEQRAASRTIHGSNEDFLYQSKIKVEMIEDCEEYLERIYEMIHRNNQLNFTKDRISMEDVTALFMDKSVRSGVVQVTDNYGDHGITGCYAVKNNKAVQFVFSCRIMGMGVEQYCYAKLGFPEINVVGEVAGELVAGVKPGWINHVADKTGRVDADSLPISAKPRLLIYGGCIVAPIYGFVENQADAIFICEIFTQRLHIGNIGGAVRLSEEQKKYITENVSCLVPRSFDSIIFKRNQFVFTCLQNAFAFWKYTSKEASDFYFFSHKLTSNNSTQEVRDKFIGEPTTIADIERELAYICDNLPDGSKLVIMNLPDFKEKVSGMAADYYSRVELNNIAEKVANEKSNCIILDVRNFVRSEADLMDRTVNHYVREVGFKISQSLLRIMGVGGRFAETEKLSSADEFSFGDIPQNAVNTRDELSINTDDEPGYVAFVRNGKYYINITIEHKERYEVKYLIYVNRKLIEETDYSDIKSYMRNVIKLGRQWAKVVIRQKDDPMKITSFSTSTIDYNEFNLANYYDTKQPDFEESFRGLSAFFMRHDWAKTYRQDITRKLFLLKSHGISVVDWFKLKGIENVSLWSDSEFYPILLQSIEGTGFKFRHLFVEDWLHEDFPEWGWSGRKTFTDWTGSDVGSTDNVLVCTVNQRFSLGDEAPRIREAKANPIAIFTVLNELITREFFNKKIKNTLKEKGVDIPVIALLMPNAFNYPLKTSSDATCVGFSEKDILKKYNEAPDSSPTILKSFPYEELQETLVAPTFHRLPGSDIVSIRDVSGKYLNVVGGFRRTVGQPKIYDGTIYIFGGLSAFGFGVKDEDTIASRLQKIFPNYKVENYSNYEEVDEWQNMCPLIQSINFKPTDIIVIQCFNKKHSSLYSSTLIHAALEEPCVKVDTYQLFDTPGRPDLFIIPFAVAPWGNQKIAELLRDTIAEIKQ